MGELLFNPNDGLSGRDGGPYLDIEQAKADEIIRAKREGREPDLDNPPANAGIPLSAAHQLLRTVDVNRPSKIHTTHEEARRMFKNAHEAPDTELRAWDTRPDKDEAVVEETTEVVTNEDNDPLADLNS